MAIKSIVARKIGMGGSSPSVLARAIRKAEFNGGPNYNSKTGVTKIPGGLKANTTGLKMGTRQANPKGIRQYGDKGYKPSNGVGVGH